MSWSCEHISGETYYLHCSCQIAQLGQTESRIQKDDCCCQGIDSIGFNFWTRTLRVCFTHWSVLMHVLVLNSVAWLDYREDRFFTRCWWKHPPSLPEGSDAQCGGATFRAHGADVPIQGRDSCEDRSHNSTQNGSNTPIRKKSNPEITLVYCSSWLMYRNRNQKSFWTFSPPYISLLSVTINPSCVSGLSFRFSSLPPASIFLHIPSYPPERILN